MNRIRRRLLAAAAAGGVLLIVFALIGSRALDPVQARLTQLGSMQAQTLEEMELQQPVFERTLRPVLLRLTGMVRQRRLTLAKVSETVTSPSGYGWCSPSLVTNAASVGRATICATRVCCASSGREAAPSWAATRNWRC